jgi:hypothetical protein
MQCQNRRVTHAPILIMMLCVGPLLAVGQSFNREKLVGAWTSVAVSFTEPVGRTAAEKETVEKTKRGLVNSQFIFKPNGLFLLRLPANAPTEFGELKSMNNKMWHIRSKEHMVFVGDLEDDLMIINVKIANGFYYFFIQDTPLVLKMQRAR